jgi:hypothetical protein
MDIKGPIPFRAAAAYSFTPHPSATPAASPNTPSRVDRFEPAELLGGKVRSAINRGVGFDGDHDIATAATKNSTGALPLYSRSAEQVEAATRIALGRNIDITG